MMAQDTSPQPTSDVEASFAETALQLGGKSEDEARRTGAIDRADDQVEALFAPQYQTVNSPAHRAVWDRGVPVEEFTSEPVSVSDDIQPTLDRSCAIVNSHLSAGTYLDDKAKIRQEVLDELGEAGYWGLLVDKQYGGSAVPFTVFAPFLARMATIEPTIAGMASVHGCIGAVDPLSTFGNPQQKAHFLPGLADGSRLSAFALTEPCAGSDLTALRTTATREGNGYLLNGEKLFITNVTAGRTIAVVCLLEGQPAVLIAELPREPNDHFEFRHYGLYALKHTHNQGMIFRDFCVPEENLLTPARGDGLTIAYHGLNLGRVALCANAAGTMRKMLASMIPWAQFRTTYGEKIATRELVRRRLGRLAGMVVACDALVAWCSQLIERGYRGEMECVIAKIFGSEIQKEAAIELMMKTHGGRSFLHGHMFGDNVHEFLAPCIYEGEGEMLAMGFFKSLVKEHGKTYFEPIGKALQAAGIKKPNPLNPSHAWALKSVVAPYAKWLVARRLMPAATAELPHMPIELARHAEFACDRLHALAVEISQTMSKYQLALADRQCRMVELSARTQNLIVILATALYAARQEDALIRDAADLMCRELRYKVSYRKPSDRYYRHATRLGEAIAEGQYKDIADVQADAILMQY